MRKFLTKGIAVLMAASMLIEMPLAGVVQASELDSAVEFHENGNASTEDYDDDSVSSNDVLSADNSDGDLYSDKSGDDFDETGASDEWNEDKQYEEEHSDEENTVSENEIEEDDYNEEAPLLQYVYIESPMLETPNSQNILIGIGDENTGLLEGTLTYQNIRTREIFTVTSNELEKNVFSDAILFEKEFDDADTGIYQLLRVEYKTEHTEDQIDLTGLTGIYAYFGVNEQVVYSDEEPDYDNLDITAEVIAVNENGDAEAVASVEEALAAAEISVMSQSSPMARASQTARAGAGSGLVIMLDPGHDGISVGASGGGVREEVAVLKIAQYCKAELETYANVTVHMTRENGSCPAGYTGSHDLKTCLESRVKKAQNVGANVFVSFHLNSNPSSSPQGAEVYYPNTNYNASASAAGKIIASKIQAKLAALGLSNRGIKTWNASSDKYPDGSAADYLSVIRNAKKAGIPAVLIEHAFVSNASDAAFLSSEANLKKLGIADATGIAESYNLAKKGNTVEYTSGNLTIQNIDLFAGTFEPNITGVTPTKSLEKVIFKVWTKSDKSDMKSYKAKVTNGVYSASVSASKHNKAEGKYYVEAYAVDTNGSVCYLKKKTVNLTPVFTGVSYTRKIYGTSQNQYRIEVKGLEKASSVKLELWHTKSGTSKKISYNAKKTSKGVWYYNIPLSKLEKEGKYSIKAYATAAYGTAKTALSKSFTYERKLTVAIKATSKKQTKFQAVLGGGSYFKNVKFAVWSKAGGKDDLRTYKAKKKNDGTWYYNIPINKHKSEGVYYVETYGTIGGKEEKIVSKKSFKVTGPSATKMTITNKDEDNLSFKVTVSGNTAPSGIKKAEVLVWSKKDKSDLKTYKKNVNSKGNFSAVINLKNHKYNFGKYSIEVVLTDNNNIRKTVLTKKYTFKQPVSKASASAANKSETKYNLSVDKLAYAGSVTFEVWSKVNGKDDLKTYNAKKGTDGVWNYKMAAKNHKGGGTYCLRVYAVVNGKKQLAAKTNFKVKEDVNSKYYSIMGDTSVTVSQMMAYYNANASYPSYYKGSDAPDLKTFCNLYLSESKKEGIRAEVAFIQAMKETNFLKYGGDVDISQYNFAGIGAVGGGASGHSFSSVKMGIRGQVQHLKAYASTDGLKNACVDPRFTYVKRGCAPYVEWLGIKENPQGLGWATDPGYGIDIVNRIKVLKSY